MQIFNKISTSASLHSTRAMLTCLATCTSTSCTAKFLSVIEPDRACSTYITSLGSGMNSDSWTESEGGENFRTESKNQFNDYCVPECVKLYLNRLKTRKSQTRSRVQLCRQKSSIRESRLLHPLESGGCYSRAGGGLEGKVPACKK